MKLLLDEGLPRTAARLLSEADYEAALAEIERLFEAAPNTPESDHLDVLATLVEAYEAHHYPVPEPDPVEAIKYHMESRGLSRADLEPYIGGRARHVAASLVRADR